MSVGLQFDGVLGRVGNLPAFFFGGAMRDIQAKCPACERVFDNAAAMRQHFNDTHRRAANVPFSDEEQPDSTVDGSIPAHRCENCRYWGKANGTTACRAHPGVGAMVPGPTGQLTAITLYPPSLANEWCGEWSEKGTGALS